MASGAKCEVCVSLLFIYCNKYGKAVKLGESEHKKYASMTYNVFSSTLIYSLNETLV
jgi:hypothetical protein